MPDQHVPEVLEDLQSSLQEHTYQLIAHLKCFRLAKRPGPHNTGSPQQSRIKTLIKSISDKKLNLIFKTAAGIHLTHL
jgi:hypothetical protein